ncbi:MAG: 16S rRNA (cytidine(1402)-2'-O)-methyltransferase [Clostridia bacterium]
MATLYIVPTPIGNMSDMSPHGREILQSVDFIACEDTRVGGKLCMLLDIKKPLVSYHEHNKLKSGEAILDRLKKGESCAIVTDAGTPAVSDPGEELVNLCHNNNIKVIPLAGPCAATVALSASGLPSKRFCFEGFLPEGKKALDEYFDSVQKEKRTLIYYSAPHDLTKTLSLLLNCFGNRRAVCCKELTKFNEKIIFSDLEQLLTTFLAAESIKGEYVIVVEGYLTSEEDEFWYSMTVSEHVAHYTKLGLGNMEAIKQTAKDRGISKGTVYDEMINQ